MRKASPMVNIIGNGGGDGAAWVAGNGVVLWNTSTGKKAAIKKLFISNRTGANVQIWIGYGDRTVAASVFRQVIPAILVLNGVDMELSEEDIPQGGNAPDGYCNDATAITGTTGPIIIESSASAAAPNNVQVSCEVEEW